MQCGSCRGPALVVGEEPVEAAAAEMVSLTGQQSVRVISDGAGNAWQLIKERGGDYRGVHIDSGQVDRDSAAGSIEFGPARRQRFRPTAFVPAVTDDDVGIRMASGIGGETRHGILSARGIVQAQTRHGQASLDQVHMSIDERRGDQPSSKINFGFSGSRSSGCVVTTNEADHGSIAYQRSGTWIVGRVDASPDEDHESVRMKSGD
jgi:hypothetical protein